MKLSLRKTGFLPGVSTMIFLVLALPVIAAIFAALALTASAAYENVKFVHCSEQMLSIIAMLQDDAGKETTFGTIPNENFIDTLARRAQLATVPVPNSWGSTIRVTAAAPLIARMETDIPSRACRRLGAFFSKNAKDLRLLRMDVRIEDSPWNTFYSPTPANETPLDNATLNNACGKSQIITLAIYFQLR
jgi:hypothetical protein